MIKIGKKSEEFVQKLYKGIGAINVVAVNPNKEKLQEITGREITEEPVYTGTLEDGKKYARVTFYVKTDETAKINNGINVNTNISFMITDAPVTGSSTGKIKVIDKYARTAWVTKDEFNSKSIPVYSNGPARISKDYRPLYQGEENLINFLIAWLNVPSPEIYDNTTGSYKENPKIEDCEISLDMKKILTGNVSEIADIIPAAFNYTVKCVFGVRTTSEGKQYQEIFNRMFLKNANNKYEKLDAAIKEVKNNGGLASSEFDTMPLHEYTVEATDFTKEEIKTEDTSSPWDNMFN